MKDYVRRHFPGLSQDEFKAQLEDMDFRYIILGGESDQSNYSMASSTAEPTTHSPLTHFEASAAPPFGPSSCRATPQAPSPQSAALLASFPPAVTPPSAQLNDTIDLSTCFFSNRHFNLHGNIFIQWC